MPVVFVEAYTSALAIDALCLRTGQRFCAVATGGCWGWRGKVGIATSEDGTRVPEKGPLPDLDHIAFEEREAIICFDSDDGSNPKVQFARRAFTKELQSRDALVRVATVPEEDGVNGPDDFLAAHGDEALLDILGEAQAARNKDSDSDESQADKLVRLVDDVELFHRDVDQPYASIQINGHLETWAIGSRGFRQWLSHSYYTEYKKAPKSGAIQDALNVIAGRAIHEGSQIPVHVRLAENEDGIFLDLGDDMWRAVHITANGWTIVEKAPVKFVRSRGTLPLPEPITGGTLDDLQSFVNIPDEYDWALFKAFLVSAFRPNRPQPIHIVLTQVRVRKRAELQLLANVFHSTRDRPPQLTLCRTPYCFRLRCGMHLFTDHCFLQPVESQN